MTDELEKAVANLTKHIHEGNYEGILLSGSTNEVSQSLFTTSWTKLYPDQTPPKIYSFDTEANNILYKKELTDDEMVARATEIIRQQFPDLEQNKGKLLCYIDEFIQTGHKYKSLKKAFHLLGFTNVDFAFLVAQENTEWSKEIFVASKNNELAGEFSRLSLERHGYPSTVEAVEGDTVYDQEHWRNEGKEHLAGLNDLVKRK